MDLLSDIWEGWSQHIFIVIGTVVMFILQRRRARRIFRLQRETVVVFTKYPEVGKAKTRLKPALGEGGAARAHLLMTDHMVSRLIEHQRKHPDLSIDLSCAGATQEQLDIWFKRKSENSHSGLTWHHQGIGDLGQRMSKEFIRQVSRGEDRVIIVGADIPSITGEDVEEAMSYLRKEDKYDMVLGEATDGGYYLVGLNNNGASYVRELFEDIPWSTDRVFKLQFAKAVKLGLRIRVLTRKYSDIDRPEDIPIMMQQLRLKREDVYFPRWSVVIPAYNEEITIKSTLDSVVKRCSCKDKLEIIVVDGGSTDRTKQEVLKFSKTSCIKITLAESPKGRGSQLRAGADLASGFYLFFLHSDCTIPEDFDAKAEEMLLKPGTSAGAFRFTVDALYNEDMRKEMSTFFLLQMKMIAWGTHIRSHYKELPYGDQGLFLTKPMYQKVGGFPAWPLMEDFHIVEKLQTQGLVCTSSNDYMVCSARRWIKNGPLVVLFMNTIFVLAYKIFGVKPERLAEIYYGKPKRD